MLIKIHVYLCVILNWNVSLQGKVSNSIPDQGPCLFVCDIELECQPTGQGIQIPILIKVLVYLCVTLNWNVSLQS
jgi:hypothetical protein